MSKKVLALVVSAIMITGVLVGCGDSAPAQSSPSNNTEKTESTSSNDNDKKESQDKDADNSSENTENSESTKVIQVPVTIVNNTDVDFHELYTSGSGVDEWGENIIPEGQVLSPGTQLSQIAFTIDENNVKWDLLAMDANGDSLEFYDLDLSNCDVSGITISLTYDRDTQMGVITAQ